MQITKTTFLPAIVMPALLLAAALSGTTASAQAAHQHGAAVGTPPAPSAPSAHAGMDMKGMLKDGNDKMAAVQTTGDPDIDFALMMRVHHQGGVDMAREQLRVGRNPQMRKMAQDIIDSQNYEIGKFEKFLARKGHPVGKPKK